MSANASEKVDNWADHEYAAHYDARPFSEAGEGDWGAENVEERFDPDWAHEAHVVLQVFLANKVAQEK